MNVVSKIREIYHTLRHVKPIQLSYRLKYEIRHIHSLRKVTIKHEEFSTLSMLPLPSHQKFIEKKENGLKACFLNLEKIYRDKVNWADLEYGKLWNYHLQYADFLKQDNLSTDVRSELILDLYQWLDEGKLKPEPYPASLRIMNVIRFVSTQNLEMKSKKQLIEFVFSELNFLENRLEYHLLGNHLMENAFALLMGGVAFSKHKFIHTAEDIFSNQIPEQILDDGAHFERSPMYHIILLSRFLEAVHYLPSDSKLSSQFYSCSKRMLSWLNQMSFKNGDLAHFNDSTDNQTFTKNEIINLAEKCGVTDIDPIKLSDSGYRKFENETFELLTDACGIEPSYQPGHTHADSLSIILHVNGQPVITDPGISTYQAGGRRDWERSTKAHNTVTFDGQNTADVWSQFRVGRRPAVCIEEESDKKLYLHLTHKLHSGELFKHRRNFRIADKFLEIVDNVNLHKPVEGRLYFDPTVKIKTLTNKKVELANDVTIHFSGVQKITQFSYECCEAFNLRRKSIAIEYSFIKQASVKIEPSIV